MTLVSERKFSTEFGSEEKLFFAKVRISSWVQESSGNEVSRLSFRLRVFRFVRCENVSGIIEIWFILALKKERLVQLPIVSGSEER